jgi:hypothetical protein
MSRWLNVAASPSAWPAAAAAAAAAAASFSFLHHEAHSLQQLAAFGSLVLETAMLEAMGCWQQ